MNILNFLNNLIFKTVYAQETVQSNLPFTIPNLVQILAFLVRFMLIIAGLAALIFLVLGALSWVTSSGEKEKVSKAQEKIQAAVVGLVVLVAVLALIVTLEQVVFRDSLCLGVTCDITKSMPPLLKPNPDYIESGVTVAKGGVISYSMKKAGSNYSLNDRLILSGGDEKAEVIVTALDSSNGITTLRFSNRGSNYNDVTGVVLKGGGGSGAEINITVQK